jgi:predicted transcriptional regulator
VDQRKKLSWDDILNQSSEPKPLDRAEPSEPHLNSVLRLITPADEVADKLPPTRRSSPEEWSHLIERVRSAATRVREVETEAHEQELRVHELLERVREDIANANERVKAAEAHTREIQARADALLKAADERVRVAEERARIAEEWLARVYDTIASEFAFAQPEKRTA